MIKKTLAKITCYNGKIICIYTLLALIALINSIIISIERKLCDDSKCDNTNSRLWIILTIVGCLLTLIFVIFLLLFKAIKKKSYNLSKYLFLLALLLYVCFISLDKIYNYDQIFSKSHYTTILRSSNIFISVIISILLLRKICNC